MLQIREAEHGGGSWLALDGGPVPVGKNLSPLREWTNEGHAEDLGHDLVPWHLSWPLL